MLRKSLMVALVVAGAFGALPALASADPEIELNGNSSFTVSGGAQSLATKEFSVTCTSAGGSGKFENSQTGTIEIVYQGCKSSLGVSCTTAGRTTGTIATTLLPFRTSSATGGKLAMLISAKEGHFSSFSCSFLSNVVVSGNGVIGIVTSPGFGESSTTMSVLFSGKEGVQGDRALDGEETEDSLKASINGGAAAAASLAGEIKLAFAGQVQPIAVQTLSVEIKPGAGQGTVKSTPIGIHCVIKCDSLFKQNTVVKLEAVELGFNFKGWKARVGTNPGTCTGTTTPCQLTLSAKAELEAFFE